MISSARPHLSAEDLSAGGSEEVRHFAASTGQRLYAVAFGKALGLWRTLWSLGS